MGGTGVGVDGDVGAIGDLEGEDGFLLAVDVFLRDAEGEIALDAVEAEGGFVTVVVEAPGEDADLVEIEGQAAVERSEDGDVLGFLLRDGRCGWGVIGGFDDH